MTWPACIAVVLGVIAVLMICASQHGLGTTTPHDPPDGDQP